MGTVKLPDGSTLSPIGRRTIQVTGNSGYGTISRDRLLGSVLTVEGEIVAIFGPAYGDFEVFMADSERPLLELMLATTASGAYRLVQRGQLVDRAGLRIGSPFRSPRRRARGIV
jgi:hypothetical protein